MAKKKIKIKFNIFSLIPIACAILAIVMFLLPFLKNISEGGIALGGLSQSGKSTNTITGFALAFGLGDIKCVTETSGTFGDGVSTNMVHIDEMGADVFTLIAFICYALAAVVSVVVLFAPKKCKTASYLLTTLLFVAGIVFAMMSKNGLQSANEDVFNLYFSKANASWGVCLSSTFGLGGIAGSVLSLKK